MSGGDKCVLTYAYYLHSVGLQVGQMSDVIKTQFGYHIILCEGEQAGMRVWGSCWGQELTAVCCTVATYG